MTEERTDERARRRSKRDAVRDGDAGAPASGRRLDRRRDEQRATNSDGDRTDGEIDRRGELVRSVSRRTMLSSVGVGLAGVVVGFSGVAGATFAGGSGTQESPYRIETWEHLHDVRYDPDAHFELVADLDAETDGYDERAGESANDGDGWDPIGGPGSGFSGAFDGNGHVISDAFVERTGTGDDLIGLFAELRPDGTLENVGVKNQSVTGRNQVGGLVGHSSGEITRCFATGAVDGEDQYGSTMIGGLVGNNLGEITESYASGIVTGDYDFGGLVGSNDGIVTDSYYDSELNVTGIGDESGSENDVVGLETDDMLGIAPAPWGDDTMPAFDFDADWTVVVDDFPIPRPPEDVLDPIGPFEQPPRDLDGDGLYEDVNGDGESTVADVQALHRHLEDEVVTTNPEKFDFAGEDPGTVTDDDVAALYERVTEGDGDA
ncbi:GLUG motif-containing protein [Natrarchaeobius oligotrophus]|uniref:GLUG domain-containing protein n=1 Tax=Natrarchaeobius chitinivorans TaxID=1679083 RepID=A0A3N6MGZ0_NATCH|nr:GLUG motif-containing protein [Natrarchaeobius chitinivorans]RQH03364.1 hypothetical protein EA472_02000 [Natrarchaeobius chitinivorans]